MAATKCITLITGANSGVGYALAKLLLADSSNHVLLGARNASKGASAVQELQAANLPGSIELLEINVDSADSVHAAAEKVTSSHGRLDALVNNAGIASAPGDDPHNPQRPMHEHLTATFRTNATGPHLVTTTFAPLLESAAAQGTTPRIVHVSSGAGSIARRMDKSSPMYKSSAVAYRASKAAMNMIAACHAAELGDKFGAKVFVYCPGFCVSGLSSMNTAEMGAKDAAEGARPMVGMLKGERDGESGKFLHATGEYPW